MLSDDIKAARKRKGYTQRQLADAAGLSLDSIKSFESGSAPGPDSLQRLCGAIDLAPSPVLDQSGEILLTLILPGGMQLQIKKIGPR